MQKIQILAKGTIKENYLKEGINEYLKRLKRYCDISIIEFDDELKIIKLLNKNYNILMDLKGDLIDSIELAKIINKNTNYYPIINFLIGGYDGINNNIMKFISSKISFGKITLNHRIFRLILLEQIYRGFTIINNHPYHH